MSTRTGKAPAVAPSDGSGEVTLFSRGSTDSESVSPLSPPCSPSSILQAAGSLAAAAPPRALARQRSLSSSAAGPGLKARGTAAYPCQGDAKRQSAQAGAFPALPFEQISGVRAAAFKFDSTACSDLLEVAAPDCLRCVSNATRASQGVCFLEPPVRRGERAEIRFRFDNKPGRMRYFLGISRGHFKVDAADTTLRAAGWSIENLYAGPHLEAAPHRTKAPPFFHTGSVVTVVVDLTDSVKAHASFNVDSSGIGHTVQLPGRTMDCVVVWASLYNRFAQLTLLDMEAPP